MRAPDRTDETAALIGRLDLLDRLCRSPAQLRDLVEETGQARSTVNRGVNELEELGFVRRGGSGIEVTAAGHLARNRLAGFFGDLDDILLAREVLEPVTAEAGIDELAIVGGESILAADPAPYRPLSRIYDDLTAASAYRALVPALHDPRTVGVLYEHVVTAGRPAELVVTEDVFRTLREEFPRRMAAMAETEGFTVLVGEVGPFGLGLLEGEEGGAAGAETVVHVVVHTDGGGVHGLLRNETDRAVSWAESRYAEARAAATDRTAAFVPNTDGGTQHAVSSATSTLDSRLPVSLEREGFARLDAAYFHESPVAKPAMAWRAGLSLAEVHTGYAIERVAIDAGEGVGDDEAESGPSSAESPGAVDAAQSLVSELAGGGHCVVIGPPGAGKSTVCKQVACRWYERDLGAVLYREGGRGQSFEAVGDLVRTAREETGHVLVVVEDAVRPDAVAIFEAIDRFEPESVSVLLDARTSEWSDRPAPATERTAMNVVSLPPIRRGDCERLVEHFERTTTESVDVPTDQLWSTVRGAAGDEEADGTHQLLRLIHRLATYADPRSDGPTALEEDVAEVYDDLATDGRVLEEADGTTNVSADELAPSACLLANALNAAGMAVEPALCYAAFPTVEATVVEEALDRLHGTVLFEDAAGGYRTVHEEWSTAYLTHLIDAEGEERAAERFGAVMSDLLALADEDERRDRIARQLEDPWALSVVADDPTRWADELAASLYSMGEKRGNLAPLFGDGRRDSIAFPEACSATVEADRPRWLGNAFLAGGFYDRAERSFERLPETDPSRAIERCIGLARASTNRGAFEDAIEHCEAGLALVEELPDSFEGEDPAGPSGTGTEAMSRAIQLARLRRCYGDALSGHNQYADAQAQYELALEAVDEASHPRLVAQVRRKTGDMRCKQGDYDDASAEFEASLELARTVGDRRLEADVLSNFGTVPWSHGDNDGARGYFERALEIQQAIGDRHGVAKSRYNLAIVAKREGEYDRAEELLERSLAGLRAVDDSQTEIRVLGALGLNLMRQGSYERAQRLLVQWLDRSRELNDRHDEARALNNLALVLTRRGRYDRASRLYRRSLSIKREVGDRRGEVRTMGNLAEVEIFQGRLETARERLEAALELLESFDGVAEYETPLTALGTIELRRGNLSKAVTHFERARDHAIEANASNKQAVVCLCLGEVAILEGDPERASSSLEEAVTAIDGTESQLALPIRVLRGRVALAEGRLEDARSAGTTARAEAESMGAPLWVGRSTRLLGAVAFEAGDFEEAASRTLDALETFEEIGAYPDAIETIREVAEREADWDGDQLAEGEDDLVAEPKEHGPVPIEDQEQRIRDVLEAAPAECLDGTLSALLESA